MTGFEVKIVSSTAPLTAKQRIAVKDTTNAVSLDEATRSGKIAVVPVNFVELAVHNEHAKQDKDYTKFVLIDDSGNKFSTGSQAFADSLRSIMAEMDGEDEAYAIEVYRMPSKNHAGKEFITCSII